jgi:ParB family chromosome partitioning protein
LLQLVDDTVLKDKRTALTMGLRPAVELSYLNQKEQEMVYEEIYYEELTPSHYQAKRMRELSEKGKLNADEIENILCEEKGNQREQISFNKEKIEKALPSELLRRDKRYIEQYILKAIDFYKSAELERGDNNDLDL